MIRKAEISDNAGAIVELILQTDQLIPFLFGHGERAQVALKELFQRKHNAFSFENMLVAQNQAGDPQGILLAYDPKQKSKELENQVFADVFSTRELLVLWFKSLFIKAIESKQEIDGLYIQNVSVNPAHRGKGIGTKLMLHLEREAEAQGYQSIWLDVSTRNPLARKLYESLGYQVVSEKSVNLGKVGFYRMRKSIRSSQA